jgi:hypothetical protein
VMRKFAEFDRYAAKLEFVTIPRATLRSILDSADSRLLERVGAETGGHIPSEISFFFYKDLGLPIFLKHLENMSRYYRMGAVEFAKNQESTIVAINHDLGPNWSAFLSQYLIHAARGITGVTPACETSKAQVSLRFKTPGLGLQEHPVKSPA